MENIIIKALIKEAITQRISEIDKAGDEAAEWPSRRHNGGANFSFSDGHAEYGAQDKMVSRDPNIRRRWNADNLPHLDQSPN